MKMQFVIITLMALLYSTTALAGTCFVQEDWPEVVRVEKEPNCGVGASVWPSWADYTTKFYEMNDSNRHFIFGTDLVNTDIDGILITVKRDHSIFPEDQTHDWWWFRKYNGSEWVWDGSVDEEGWLETVAGEIWPGGPVYYDFYYRMIELNEICNRSYKSSNGYPRVAKESWKLHNVQNGSDCPNYREGTTYYYYH